MNKRGQHFDDKIMGQEIMKLRGDKTQQEIADALGVKRETVKQWENAERKIKAEDIFRLAKHFGVSSDYLLGLSAITSPDENIQAICKKTGLTEKTVNLITENKFPDYAKMINILFETTSFINFLEDVFFCIYANCLTSRTEDLELYFTCDLPLFLREKLKEETGLEEEKIELWLGDFLLEFLTSRGNVVKDVQCEKKELAIFNLQKSAIKLAEELITRSDNEMEENDGNSDT